MKRILVASMMLASMGANVGASASALDDTRNTLRDVFNGAQSNVWGSAATNGTTTAFGAFADRLSNLGNTGSLATFQVTFNGETFEVNLPDEWVAPTQSAIDGIINDETTGVNSIVSAAKMDMFGTSDLTTFIGSDLTVATGGILSTSTQTVLTDFSDAVAALSNGDVTDQKWIDVTDSIAAIGDHITDNLNPAASGINDFSLTGSGNALTLNSLADYQLNRINVGNTFYVTNTEGVCYSGSSYQAAFENYAKGTTTACPGSGS